MNFWCTQEWIEYLVNSKIGVEIIDRSFYIDNKFIPLIQNGQEFYSPEFDDDKKILQQIRELAQEHNIKRIQVNSQIKSYLNISGYTCIINPFEIKPSKGHKSAIKTANKYLKHITFYNIERFRKDYFKIAGKQTRPNKTFELLENWRLNQNGTLLTAIFGDKIAGHIYILHTKDWAYYFMSGVFPEYKQYNVTHYLQSVAFEILRSKGIKTYELGDQVYNSLIMQPSEKELNISKFKRNFGGNIVVKPASEYFFDSNFFKKTMLNRINKYMEAEYENTVDIPQT